MELKPVRVENPEALNFILGQTHFIKTVEDVYDALVTAVPGIKFGMAFCEASGPCLVRHTGTDDKLEDLAVKNAEAIGAGHSFIVFLRDSFPVNILPALRNVAEVCGIYCATANPTTVVVAEDETGRGIMGVIDGEQPKGIETGKDQADRKEMLQRFGYRK